MDDCGNWDTASLPATTDSVCIGQSFASTTITIGAIGSAENQTIASLITNANIAFTSGPLTVTGGATFINNLTMTGGGLTLNGTNGSAIGGAMTQGNSVLAGTDTLTVSGLITLNANAEMCTTDNCSTPSGAQGVTNANGGIASSGSINIYLIGRTLNNRGTATFSNTGGSLSIQAAATINNLAGATWNLATDFAGISAAGIGGTFNNAGTFERTGGSGTSTVSAVFVNTATVAANVATLSFTGSYTQTAGTTFLGGGILNYGSSPSIQGGVLGGSGSITGNYTRAISINPGGALAPGTTLPSPLIGTRALSGSGSGNYTEGTGSFNVKIGGTAAGQFDTVTATGTATLGGALNGALNRRIYACSRQLLYDFDGDSGERKIRFD